MQAHAKGIFEVKSIPQIWSASSTDDALRRCLLDKHYSGDLEAISHGQMLSISTGVKGSAGYVAIEKLIGTLQGRNGTFVMQHNGTMNRGEPKLTISIVPDSGTGELRGLQGTMTIEVADGKHSYELAYTLATID
jgi:hypothetical protein